MQLHSKQAKKKMRSTVGATIAIVLGALTAGCDTSTPDDSSDWELVWQDEFNGPAGQLPDSTKWSIDVGTDWGNGQLEYDTDRPENVSMDGNGNLAIVAREEEYMGQNYTSARIHTQGLFEQMYGRFEARINLPIGQGIWPAFWMLGSEFNVSLDWPEAGEIDIMEYRGHEPDTIHGTLHGPGYSGMTPITGLFDLNGEGFDGEFHTFAVEWNDSSITWFIDEEPYQTFTPNDRPEGTEWVFDQPFFLILNLAVGGGWPGPPDENTVFPQTMLIDYVRVYRRIQ